MTGANDLILGTTILAGIVVVLFLILVLRRFFLEKNKARQDQRDTAITRNYVQRVGGYSTDESTDWPRSFRLAAITRILPLLRGGEKTRLLQIAELDGVLKETVRNSHSLYRSERINAVQLLQRFGSELCIARLRELMVRDRSPSVRLEAAFALGANGALPPPRETLRSLKALGRKPTRLDLALLRVTASLYPEQMALLLEDDLSSEWRTKIIDSLGWSGDMGVITLLETASTDDDSEIRCAALRAAGKLGHPAAKGWILTSLRDPAPSVRLQAIGACMQLDLHEAVPVLIHMQLDTQLWVRLRAEQALERLAPEQLVTAEAADTVIPLKAIA